MNTEVGGSSRQFYGNTTFECHGEGCMAMADGSKRVVLSLYFKPMQWIPKKFTVRGTVSSGESNAGKETSELDSQNSIAIWLD